MAQYRGGLPLWRGLGLCELWVQAEDKCIFTAAVGRTVQMAVLCEHAARQNASQDDQSKRHHDSNPDCKRDLHLTFPLRVLLHILDQA
jgi:hypothetical protein